MSQSSMGAQRRKGERKREREIVTSFEKEDKKSLMARWLEQVSK